LFGFVIILRPTQAEREASEQAAGAERKIAREKHFSAVAEKVQKDKAAKAQKKAEKLGEQKWTRASEGNFHEEVCH